MTAFAKGLVTFLLEVAIYAFRSIKNNSRPRRRVTRGDNSDIGWRPPDENITGNRNSQNEPIPGQSKSERESTGLEKAPNNTFKESS
jgi:hypothetical protein